MSGDSAIRLSVQAEATQAINTLNRMGKAVSDAGTAVGMTDKELRALDRRLAKLPEVVTKAATAMARAKKEIADTGKQMTILGNNNKALENKLATANKRLTEQRNIVQEQKKFIQALVRENQKLAGSYSDVAAAQAKAAAQQKKPGYDKFHGGSDVATLRGDVVAKQTAGQLQTAQKARQQELRNMQTYMQKAWGVQDANKKVTQSAATAKQAIEQVGENVQMNALRYQLYDVAATFGIVGRRALEIGLASTRAGIEWDKNFANVVRTSQVTGRAVEWLKDEFLELQTIIPVTSEDLATIATLGAQMGVAAANLANFTEITAKFSAASGMSVDESATALSRLNQLLPDVKGNYERLGSTILRTGVNAVATEQQIVRGTNQIASMGEIAGLTTPEVVALSSAMSSLGFSPELQRSIVTSSFSRILTATSAVTEQTEKFGAVLNMTGKEFQQAWREDALDTYTKFVEGVASRGDAVTVLQDLRLASQRLTPNLLKLGQNTGVLHDALADTTDEWAKNTEMTRQYDITAGTVSARIQVLSQSWEALLVTLDGASPVINIVVQKLTEFLRWLRDLAKIPGVSTIAAITGAVVTLSGVLGLAAAGLAGMAAGFIAIAGAQAGLSTLMAANTGVVTGNTGATELNTLAKGKNAAAHGVASGATGAHTTAVAGNTAALTANTLTSTKAGRGLLTFSSGLITMLPKVLGVAGAIGLIAAALAGLGTIMWTAPDWTHDIDKWRAGIDGVPETLDFNVAKLDKLAEEQMAAYSEALEKYETQPQFEGILTPELRKGMERELERATADAQAPVLRDIESTISDLDSFEAKLAAVNHVSKAMGVTQEELLYEILPNLGSALGEGAAQAAVMADETEKLVAAQERWAIHLGGITEAELGGLQSGLKSAASGFLNFGEALSEAYAVDEKTGAVIGGGLDEFISSVGTKISDFENFYEDLGKLAQRGGVQLATFFAEQGPAAAQALTDSLALDDTQLNQLNEQMALAAFYASDAFANTFAQNNSILAQVWTASGQSHEAVTAFNEALNASMRGGSIDPKILADLQATYFQDGFTLDIKAIPEIDEGLWDAYIAMQGATIQPVDVVVNPDTGVFATRWNVFVKDEAGNLQGITLPVDPTTDEGIRIIQAWREDEYRTPVDMIADLDVSKAEAEVARVRAAATATARMRIEMDLIPLAPNPRPLLMNPNRAATGGLIHNNSVVRNAYPGFASGTILKGPGTGTSDSILARLSNGEAVTRAAAVRYYGTQMMEDINNMRFPRYATGFTPQGYGGSGYGGPQQEINVNVTQMYPTTRDPIKTMKQDAEAVLAGIWT